MKITKTKKELQGILSGKSVGFVPTMGALHDGHLDLVRASKAHGLYTAVSIFVNPAQFNDSIDFEKYPVNHERDLTRLCEVDCDVVIIPTVDEVYPNGMKQMEYRHDFGSIALDYEGAYRLGHFEGVGRVVHTLFDMVKPQVAFFGEKDYQQLAVVKKLVEITGQDIEIVGVPTKREKSGLAMSSRNERLSPDQMKKAVKIYESLKWTKEVFLEISNEEILATIKDRFQEDSEWSLEYFDLIDPKSFKPIGFVKPSNVRAVIAAKLGEIRLLDNLKIV